MKMIESLTQVLGPSGYEGNVREAILRELEGSVSSIRTDALGSLIATSSCSTGSGKRVILSAHMDEIGFVATHIDDKGFVRFSTIGGVSEHILLGQKCRFVGGAVGTFGCEKLDDIKELKVHKLFIDIGAGSMDEAKSMVSVGEFAGYLGPFTSLGKRIISKSLDDRAGCAILVETAHRLMQLPKCTVKHDVFFVFSAQEEVGCRGAKTSAWDVDPHLGIALDVTRTGDTPNSRTMDIRLGGGPAVKVKDSNLIAHPKVKDWMCQTAAQAGITHQMEVLESGGTDAGAISLTRSGVPSGTLSIPCRYIHTPAEMADLGDIEGCVRLLVELLSSELPV